VGIQYMYASSLFGSHAPTNINLLVTKDLGCEGINLGR